MGLNVPGLKTVTVLRRVRQRDAEDPEKWARDPRGNAVYVDEEIEVPGCSVQPGTGQETDDQGRVQVTAQTVIYAPPSWPGGVLDAVVIDGVRHNIQGRPARIDHPRLAHVVVTVQEVTG